VIGFDPKIKRYPVDVKKGKELLDKAGFPNGLEVKLYFSPDRYPKAREVCQVIADQLAKIGIKVELVSQEFAVFWAKSGLTAASRLFTMSAARLPMPTPSTINTIAPASVRGFNTRIPSSIRLSTRNSAPAIQKNVSPCCTRLGAS